MEQTIMTLEKKDKESKEIYRLTMACDACRVRKRKCDGKSPCSYCTAKNQPCEFSTRKKRGPKRSHDQMKGSPEDGAIVTLGGSANLESVALDKIEAYNYFNYCWEYAHRLHALASRATILNPTSVPQKVQAYTALAYTARLCGDSARARVYIDQARMLSGTVYDSPEPDVASAMSMMSIYWLLVLDLPRSSYYANLAWQLVKLVPSTRIDQRLKAFVQLNTVVSDEDLSPSEQATGLTNISKALASCVQTNQKIISLKLFLDFNAAISHVLGVNLMFPSSRFKREPFTIFDDVHVREEDRLMLMDQFVSLIKMVEVRAADGNIVMESPCAGAMVEGSGTRDHFNFIAKVFGPLVKCIINWRSGHIVEALENAFQTIVGLEQASNAAIGYNEARLLAHFPQMCMVGTMAKFLYDQGYIPLAVQVIKKLTTICSVMSPDFDFLVPLLQELVPSSHLSSPTSPNVSYVSSSIPSNLPVYSPLITSFSPIEPSPSPSPTNFFMELGGILEKPSERTEDDELEEWLRERKGASGPEAGGGIMGLSAGEMSVIEGILNSTDATLDLPFIDMSTPFVNLN